MRLLNLDKDTLQLLTKSVNGKYGTVEIGEKTSDYINTFEYAMNLLEGDDTLSNVSLESLVRGIVFDNRTFYDKYCFTSSIFTGCLNEDCTEVIQSVRLWGTLDSLLDITCISRGLLNNDVVMLLVVPIGCIYELNGTFYSCRIDKEVANPFKKCIDIQSIHQEGITRIAIVKSTKVYKTSVKKSVKEELEGC